MCCFPPSSFFRQGPKGGWPILVHVEPAGDTLAPEVALLTRTGVYGTRTRAPLVLLAFSVAFVALLLLLVNSSQAVSPTKSSGVRAKHLSVSRPPSFRSSDRGQSRHWTPPPWLATIV